jgi:hypothetical protein
MLNKHIFKLLSLASYPFCLALIPYQGDTSVVAPIAYLITKC